MISRSAETLEAAAADLRRDHAAEIFVAAVDLTRSGYLERIEQTLDQHALYADVLINNAGFGLGGPFAGQEFERLEALCRLNVEALTVLTRAFLPDMLRRARGGVLNIASLGGMVPGPYQAAYYASKAYVISSPRRSPMRMPGGACAFRRWRQGPWRRGSTSGWGRSGRICCRCTM